MSNLKSYYNEEGVEVCMDETGYGSLCGRVYCAAVIWPKSFHDDSDELKMINDSKQVSKKNRKRLRPYITKNAIAYSVCYASVQEINEKNILGARNLAMHRCVDDLLQKGFIIDRLLIDGNRYTSHNDIPYICIVKGDTKYIGIACASILAKTIRDEYMLSLHEKYPVYKWDTNMGYGTKEHRKLIHEYGSCEEHRSKFIRKI